MHLGFAKAHHQIPLEEKVVWPLARRALRNLGLSVYISATAEASDFKFSTQLAFAKTHHKITPRGKSGGGLGLREIPKTLEFPYNISATAGASDFKFNTQLGFAKAHHKITRRKKNGGGPGLAEVLKI